MQDTNLFSSQPSVSTGLNSRQMAEATGMLASECPAATFPMAYGYFSGKGCMGSRFGDQLTVMFLNKRSPNILHVAWKLNWQGWQPYTSCFLSFTAGCFAAHSFFKPSTPLHKEELLLTTASVDLELFKLEQSSLCSHVKFPFCINDLIQVPLSGVLPG